MRWQLANRARMLAKSKLWRESNAERRAEYWAAWYSENRASVAQRKSRYVAANLPRYAEYAARRRARCPAWADRELIAAKYKLAKQLTLETGTKWVVDHVIPLRGAKVSGLHVPNNLQVVPESFNARKGNRWPPDLSRAAGE